MGSCSTTGSASSTRFALSNTATQRGRSYAIGTGPTSGAVFGCIAGRSAALTTITNCICDLPVAASAANLQQNLSCGLRSWSARCIHRSPVGKNSSHAETSMFEPASPFTVRVGLCDVKKAILGSSLSQGHRPVSSPASREDRQRGQKGDLSRPWAAGGRARRRPGRLR
jgi:hypothetical protein